MKNDKITISITDETEYWFREFHTSSTWLRDPSSEGCYHYEYLERPFFNSAHISEYGIGKMNGIRENSLVGCFVI